MSERPVGYGNLVRLPNPGAGLIPEDVTPYQAPDAPPPPPRPLAPVVRFPVPSPSVSAKDGTPARPRTA